MTAVFPGDPQNVDVRWRGTTHSVFAFIAAISFAISPFFIGMRQRHDRRWRRYTLYSYITATITLALSWVSGLDLVDPYAGLLQRISMGVPMVWMMITSAKLLIESGRQSASQATAISTARPKR